MNHLRFHCITYEDWTRLRLGSPNADQVLEESGPEESTVSHARVRDARERARVGLEGREDAREVNGPNKEWGKQQ